MKKWFIKNMICEKYVQTPECTLVILSLPTYNNLHAYQTRLVLHLTHPCPGFEWPLCC